MQPEEYLKLAEVEDSMWYFEALYGHVRRAAGASPDGALSVLDAGCGTGGLLLKLKAERPGWNYRGLDFSALAVDLARRRCGPEVRIVEGSVEALPYPDREFDLVISVDVLSQVPNPAQALTELKRVLRPGGTFVTNVPAYRWLWSYHDESCQTRHRYTRSELKSALVAAGFEIRELTHWNLFALPFIAAKRKLLPAEPGASDVRRYPLPVEATFRSFSAIERALLACRLSLPAGSSIFAVARKP